MAEYELLTGSSANLESELNNYGVEMHKTTEFQSPTIKDPFSAVQIIQHFFKFLQNCPQIVH